MNKTFFKVKLPHSHVKILILKFCSNLPFKWIQFDTWILYRKPNSQPNTDEKRLLFMVTYYFIYNYFWRSYWSFTYNTDRNSLQQRICVSRWTLFIKIRKLVEGHPHLALYNMIIRAVRGEFKRWTFWTQI